MLEQANQRQTNACSTTVCSGPFKSGRWLHLSMELTRTSCALRTIRLMKHYATNILIQHQRTKGQSISTNTSHTNSPPFEKVRSEEVSRAIWKFPAASEVVVHAYPKDQMNLTAECSDATLEHRLLDFVVPLCSYFLKGEISADLAPYFMGVPIILLKKPMEE